VKTIVVSGAHSNVGKTSLALKIVNLLHNAVYIKIGHGALREGKAGVFYHTGTSFDTIRKDHQDAAYLIIESNRILNEITPDCAIYLTGSPQKPSAVEARKKADIIRGARVAPEVTEQLCARLELPKTIVKKIVWLAGSRPVHTSAIILAGGKSRRMGTDKALLEIDGKKNVLRLQNLLEPYFDDTILSISAEKEISFKNITVVKDLEEGHGPLMGIYSSLEASRSPVNFVIACDIPVVNMTLLFELLAQSEEYDIAAPSFAEGQCEPLFAVYTKAAAPAAQKVLKEKKRRIIELFHECTTSIVPSPDNSWYVNLNTPDDFRNFLSTLQKAAG